MTQTEQLLEKLRSGQLPVVQGYAPSTDDRGRTKLIPWWDTGIGGSTANWKKTLSPEQQARIVARHERQLRRQQAEAEVAFDNLRASLPPIRRTTPEQRLEAL